MTEKNHSGRKGEKDPASTPAAETNQIEEQQLVSEDCQSLFQHLQETVYGPANEQADKMLEALNASGCGLLKDLPGTPVYEFGRCLQDIADGRPAVPAGDRFSQHLVNLLLLGQLNPDASAELTDFLTAGANATRLIERNQVAMGRAQSAEEFYNESSESLPMYSGDRQYRELTHLGHRWKLATLEAAFWSVLNNQPDSLKKLAETASSFQKEVDEYGEFLTGESQT